MSSEKNKEVPPELEYVLQSCRAVSERRYEDALFLLKEGLRENVAVADRIDTGELITLFRTLVTVIESSAEQDFGIRLRATARAREVEEP
jgi:hypothetical protein